MRISATTMSGLQINFANSNSDFYLPITEETFKAVGLPNTIKIFDKIYDLMTTKEHLKLLKGIAFIENISVREARKRLIRWMLLEYGCRYSIAVNENEIQGTLGLIRFYIDELTKRKQKRDVKEIFEMVFEKGFTIVNIDIKPYF